MFQYFEFTNKLPLNIDVILLLQLGGPYIPMRTGRRDSKESYFDVVEDSIPNHNDSLSLVLSRFQSVGIDTEGIVALLGNRFEKQLLFTDFSIA